MQKSIIMFFLLIHGIYGLDKTGYKEHQINERGETVWLPVKYESYDQFKEESLETLALERLQMLYNLNQVGTILSNEEKKDYITKLQTNELGLASNSTPEDRQAIFGKDDKEENVSESIERMAKFLKARFQKGSRPDKSELIDGLDYIIGTCGSCAINKDISRGSPSKSDASEKPSSVLSAQPQSPFSRTTINMERRIH